jgi:hypothetical protein
MGRHVTLILRSSARTLPKSQGKRAARHRAQRSAQAFKRLPVGPKARDKEDVPWLQQHIERCSLEEKDNGDKCEVETR